MKRKPPLSLNLSTTTSELSQGASKLAQSIEISPSPTPKKVEIGARSRVPRGALPNDLETVSPPTDEPSKPRTMSSSVTSTRTPSLSRKLEAERMEKEKRRALREGDRERDRRDHWSRHRSRDRDDSRARGDDRGERELFPSYGLGERDWEKDRVLSSRYETLIPHPNLPRPTSGTNYYSSTTPDKAKAKANEINKDHENKKFSSLASVTVPTLGSGSGMAGGVGMGMSMGAGMGAADTANLICYNCGKKGHWFIDCMVGCGRCGWDGHRTIDCDFFGDLKGGKLKVEAEEVDGEKKQVLGGKENRK